jgi:hypothetical protein
MAGELKVTVTKTKGKFSHLDGVIKQNGEVLMNVYYDGKPVSTYTFVHDLAINFDPCDEIELLLTNPATQAATYLLRGECCAETFTYVNKVGNQYLFTYVSPIALTDAVLTFTCPGIVGYDAVVCAIEDLETPTNLTWTGDIGACTPITFLLTFYPNCTGKGSLNLWTDFKVNGVSKKGALSNINYKCPKN